MATWKKRATRSEAVGVVVVVGLGATVFKSFCPDGSPEVCQNDGPARAPIPHVWHQAFDSLRRIKLVLAQTCGKGAPQIPCCEDVATGGTLTSLAWGLVAVTAAVAAANWVAVAQSLKRLEYVAKPAVMVGLIAVAVALHPISSTERTFFIIALGLG